MSLALRESVSAASSGYRQGATPEGAQYVGNGPSGQRGGRGGSQREAGKAAASYASVGRRKKPGAILADSMYGHGTRLPLSESRTGGKPINIGLSSSNPGRLSIALADERAFDAAVQAFEDMDEGWLREQAKEGTIESLGVFVGKESRGDNYWLGDVWWEERTSGPDLRLTDSYTDGLVVTIGPKYMRRSPLKSETHKYGKVSRVVPKTFLMRSVQTYLRGVQDGTNGKERVYATVKRGRTKAGTPSQLRAIAELERMAKSAGREFDNRGGEASVLLAIKPNPGLKGIGQPLLMVDVGTTGVIKLTAYERHKERKLRGSAAWSYLKMELAESVKPRGVRVERKL